MWDEDDEYSDRGFSPEKGALVAKFLAVVGLAVLVVLAIYWGA